MSRNVFFFILNCIYFSFYPPFAVSQSGCKSSNSFFNWQENLKLFFENFYFHLNLIFLSIFQGTFRVLRGAKVSNIFISHKLFLIFFFENFSSFVSIACQYLNERCRCCGCKSRPFFRLNNTFLKLFLIYFLIQQ